MANETASETPGEITAIAQELDACVAAIDCLVDDGISILARLTTLRDRATVIGQRIEGRPRVHAQENDNAAH